MELNSPQYSLRTFFFESFSFRFCSSKAYFAYILWENAQKMFFIVQICVKILRGAAEVLKGHIEQLIS